MKVTFTLKCNGEVLITQFMTGEQVGEHVRAFLAETGDIVTHHTKDGDNNQLVGQWLRTE